MNAAPIVIPTGGPPQAARSGGIRLRTQRPSRLWPDPSTPLHSARGDKEGQRSARGDKEGQRSALHDNKGPDRARCETNRAHRPSIADHRRAPIINNPSSIFNSRAFTLIELLVVISIIVMLTALLLPALSRARKQARGVVCLSRLHQSSLAFKMYTDASEGRWFTADRDDDGRTGSQNWLGLVASFWANTPGCMACPMATRGWDGHSDYDAFTAWVGPDETVATMVGGEHVRGPVSYAFNDYVAVPPRDASASARKVYWATCDLRGAHRVPVLFDCASELIYVSALTGPRLTEALSKKDTRWLMCINRHNGGSTCFSWTGPSGRWD